MEMEFDLEEYSRVWKVLLILGIILILVGLSAAFFEIRSAKSFCDSEVTPLYTFNLKDFGHYCGNQRIYEYPTGWDYEHMSIKKFNIDFSKK
jgi:hypothetical protein